MKEVYKIVEQAKGEFRNILANLVTDGKGLSLERYVRFLSMQYHLTNGVQRHFMAVASHKDFMNRQKTRDFLYRFAIEEEQHYLIAQKDLQNLGQELLPCSIDTKLWWSYFDKVVIDQPFIRLGATCILENISTGNADLIQKLIQDASYLNPRNTRFLVIHQHEDLPHGAQIFQALEDANPNTRQVADLVEGADIGRVLYLRMFHWVCYGEAALSLAKPGKAAA